MAYLDPPFNTGRDAGAPHARDARVGRRRPHRLRRPPLRQPPARASPPTATLRRLPGFLEPRLREVAPAAAPARARSTSTSTTARRTTASCCSTSSSAASASSTRSSGPTTTAPSRAGAGRAKHDTILVYVKDPDRYYFDSTAVDREPYMAPGLVGAEKAAAASCRPTSGGTRSSPPPGARRPATRRRSPRACCGGSCRRRRGPGDLCLDSVRGLRDARCGGREPRPPLPAHGLQPAGRRGGHQTPATRR